MARNGPTVILRKAHEGIVENPKDKAHRSAASCRGQDLTKPPGGLCHMRTPPVGKNFYECVYNTVEATHMSGLTLRRLRALSHWPKNSGDQRPPGRSTSCIPLRDRSGATPSHYILQPLRHTRREIGEDRVGARALEGDEAFEHGFVAVDKTTVRRRHEHRIFARHLIGEGRHAEALLDPENNIEVRQAGFHHHDVGAFL